MNFKHFILFSFISLFMLNSSPSISQGRLRDYGIEIGVFKPGKHNAITDVSGVTVGHKTIVEGKDIRTGVTAIIPHQGNIFQNKVPAAIFVANGFGKLAGSTQVDELGNIETPIILTNTLSVAPALDALITYTLKQKGNSDVHSINGVVGETNDGPLSDIRRRVVTSSDVLEALSNAKGGAVEEGSIGAGTGTISFGFKGGIGTSSRVLPPSLGGYTVGVLVQSNYGGVLEIAGVPIGQLLGKHNFVNDISSYPDSDGSCMIVVITDAPLSSRNLERIAKRAFMGLAKTGSIATNGSGDYVIALSVYPPNLVKEGTPYHSVTDLHNADTSPLFLATIEATEEALINSLFKATTTVGYRGNKAEKLPVDEVVKIIKRAKNF